MKSPSPDTAAASLTETRRFLASSTKAENQVNTRLADAEKIRATLAKLGEPDYTDDSAIEARAKAELKLKLCEAAIAKSEEQLSELFAEPEAIRMMISRGGHAVANMLRPHVERRREMIAASIRMFCDSDNEAARIAQETSAYRRAYGQLSHYAQLDTYGLYSQSATYSSTVAARLRAIEDALSEMLEKKTPDVLRLLRPKSAPPTEAAAPAPAAEPADEQTPGEQPATAETT